MVNISENIGLVNKFVGKERSKYNGVFTVEELKSVGYLSLCKSAKNFDETKGVKFSTYAMKCMEWDLKREVMDNRWTTFRTTENGKEVYRRFEMAYISSAVKKDDDSKGDKENTLEEILVKESEELYSIEEKIDLNTAIKKLSEKDKKVIEMYFFENKKQSEIAKEFNTTQVSVSRMVKRILKQLRKELEC